MSVVTAIRQKCAAAFAAVSDSRQGNLANSRSTGGLLSHSEGSIRMGKGFHHTLKRLSLAKLDVRAHEPSLDGRSKVDGALYCTTCGDSFKLSEEDQDAFCCGRPVTTVTALDGGGFISAGGRDGFKRRQPRAIENMIDPRLTDPVDQGWVVV